MPSTTSTPPTYQTILHQLLPPSTPAPLLQPTAHPTTQKPTPAHAPFTPQIASLQLHPTLEALLHTLNTDLASAHFLVRHMQSPPKYEGMILHALLHRVEGDTENARAWYGDVAGSGIFEFVWGDGAEEDKEPGSDGVKEGSEGLKKAGAFLDEVKNLGIGRHKDGGDGEWQEEFRRLEATSEREVRRILAWCERRFGTVKWEEASSEFTGSAEKYKEIASKQLVGGEGWRDF